MASNRSKLARVEVPAVMAMATAKRAGDVDVVIYGGGNARVRGLAGTSVLAGVQRIVDLVGSVGHATYGHTAIARRFDPERHRRVVVFTDDQQHDSGQVRLDHDPLVYTFTWPATRPPLSPRGTGAATPSVASATPPSPPSRCWRTAGTSSGRSE